MLQIIKKIIQEFGIACPSLDLDSKLGESLGLDSQEIVEFTCMIEKEFQIKLPILCFKKTSSISNVMERIQEIQSKACKNSFEGQIESSITMRCSPEKAFAALYAIEEWPQKLPHVKHTEILYNDGVYQEFLMDVLSDTGLIRVRSVRRCTHNEEITFFQPNPPKFLKHHSGGWTFKKSETGCHVKTWHQWNLERTTANQLFHHEPARQVSDLLRSHAELALNSWKTVLEAAQ